MISLPLTSGATAYLNADYLFKLEEICDDSCKVFADEPDGVVVYEVALSAARVLNRLSRFGG